MTSPSFYMKSPEMRQPRRRDVTMSTLYSGLPPSQRRAAKRCHFLYRGCVAVGISLLTAAAELSKWDEGSNTCVYEN